MHNVKILCPQATYLHNRIHITALPLYSLPVQTVHLDTCTAYRLYRHDIVYNDIYKLYYLHVSI